MGKAAVRAATRPPKVIKYGSDFSGLDTCVYALRRIGIEVDVKFASDTDRGCQRLLQTAHEPDQLFGDVSSRKPEEACSVDVYVFTPPCQSFSSAGKGAGALDTRGMLWAHGLKYIGHHKPRAVLFENVVGMVRKKNKGVLQTIAGQLKALGYKVHARVLDARQYNVPQKRRRVYVVAVREDSVAFDFKWPEKLTGITQPKFTRIMDPYNKASDKPGRLPTTDRQKILVKKAFNQVFKAGVNPLRVPVIVDIDSSLKFATHEINQSPTLTRTRGSQGGYWISTRGRRMSTAELLRLQGFVPDEVPYAAAKVTPKQLGAMLGNGLSLPCVACLLHQLLRASGLISQEKWKAIGGEYNNTVLKV